MLDDLDANWNGAAIRSSAMRRNLRVYVASERAAQRYSTASRSLWRDGSICGKPGQERHSPGSSGVCSVSASIGRTVDWRSDSGQDESSSARADYARSPDRHRSIAMPDRVSLLNRFLAGWTAYFALAETPSVSTSSTSG